MGGLKKPGEGDEEVENEIKRVWEGVRGVEGEVGPPVGVGVGMGQQGQQQQFVGQQGVAGPGAGPGFTQSGNGTPSLAARMGTTQGGPGGPGGPGGQGGGPGQGNPGGAMA